MSKRSESTDNIYLDEPDGLSALLSGFEPSAQVYVSGQFCGAWAVDTSGQSYVPFHLIGDGQAWLHMTGREPKLLSSGDLVMFPQDSQHVIAYSDQVPDKGQINAPLTLPATKDAPGTHMICGFLRFENAAAQTLLAAFSEIVVLDLSQRSKRPQLRMLIDLMVGELNDQHLGFHGAVNHLAYLLFIEMIRADMQKLTQYGERGPGILAGLFDTKLSRALQAMHNHPSAHWTLEQLADKSAMSRTAFAVAFKQRIGISPMQYLTQHRMHLAKYWLKSTKRSIADIAQASAYETEAAFRKAFKKQFGIPPGAARAVPK